MGRRAQTEDKRGVNNPTPLAATQSTHSTGWEGVLRLNILHCWGYPADQQS